MSIDLIPTFYKEARMCNFDVFGVIDKNDVIHTLGSDSKIIGRIFEMMIQPILEKIAKDNGCIIETPESQTVYPDFVMMKNKYSNEKIAIDVKTTYVEGESKIGFTLGSFASYMRNNTKNIAYKYTDYIKHYVIGFVYERNSAAQQSEAYPFEKRSEIKLPFKNVRYFIQEKYKIAGDKPGSGNTENIGSIKTNNFSDFVNGNGPFSILGHEIYDIYWKNYPKYRSEIQEYNSLSEFLTWLPKQAKPELLYDYDFDEVLRRIAAYKTR
ncbi:MAG: hypothetical protein J6W54_05440 [Fibrobacter sp.]|uniref:type II restriction endonuclease n=1 Tax=Fibrobacter sp. TaxID=35828 RepID=UPI001B05EAF3|nr:type II restriction endonuclease [Fibrobacter sp.]MBO7060525.1 hypothetical protein [Fibrobacter sp.]